MTDLAVIHEDADLLVLDKPAGLLCVPGRGEHKQDCLSARAQARWPDALVVHRLDMATSGLVLMARSPAMQRALGDAFAARRVHKRYEAIVDGLIEGPSPSAAVRAPFGTAGRGLMPLTQDWSLIDAPLMADWPRRPLQKIDAEHGKPSQTRWRVKRLLPERDATHLWLEPLTGRSHQLRVHLLSIGHPILGDALYGSEAVRQRADRLLLHASVLEFAHPADGRVMRFESSPPFS